MAHESQLHLAGDIPSRRAVLGEPASIGLHAALQWRRRGNRPSSLDQAIGLLTTAALRMHPDLDIIVVAPDDFWCRGRQSNQGRVGRCPQVGRRWSDWRGRTAVDSCGRG